MNPITETLNSIVSINEFNRGGAGRIFSSVEKSGPKVVVKNNAAACVLIAPDDYRAMIDEIADARLAAVAAQRLLKTGGKLYTQEKMMEEAGLTAEDLETVEVDFE